MPVAKKLLEVKNLGIRFGGLQALEGLSFEVQPQELVGLIGPNGAGKTTAFNLLSGVYEPTSGQILFNEREVHGLKPYAVNRIGIARTFQNIRLFSNLSVLENVLIAAAKKINYGFLSGLIQTKKFVAQEKGLEAFALQLLDLFSLSDVKNERAGNLSYGQQRRLEIVRALSTEPKLLLLDEPAAGMNPSETKSLMHLISKIRNEFNVAILLIEHDMKLVMGICEKIVVLDHGELIAQGKPEEIIKNKKVIEAYLGTEPA